MARLERVLDENMQIKKGKESIMKQMNQIGSTSIAWYKLAELIAKREREKALNVYRLLSHSFIDKAYALQLEADILFSLQDKDAVEKYKQAAFLYRQERRWINAVYVYEHLLDLDANNAECIGLLLDLYAKMDLVSKFDRVFDSLCIKIKNKTIDDEMVIRAFKKMLDIDPAGGRTEATGLLLNRLKDPVTEFPQGLLDRLKISR